MDCFRGPKFSLHLKWFVLRWNTILSAVSGCSSENVLKGTGNSTSLLGCIDVFSSWFRKALVTPGHWYKQMGSTVGVAAVSFNDLWICLLKSGKLNVCNKFKLDKSKGTNCRSGIFWGKKEELRAFIGVILHTYLERMLMVFSDEKRRVCQCRRKCCVERNCWLGGINTLVMQWMQVTLCTHLVTCSCVLGDYQL